MARLEELTKGTRVRGVIGDVVVTIVEAQWHGSDVVELTYKDAAGKPGNDLLYRDREPTLEIVTAGRPWSFDADGRLFKLATEARRIRLAWLVDPLLAVNTSNIEPLPHQITAVYEEMLQRQPLRFLLADDPGAGKTIMTGLLIKELIARGDLKRCLICSPGSLAEQWQDELDSKFHLRFEMVSRLAVEESASGNPFAEKNLVIARLDQLARSEEIQAKLREPGVDWDLIVCDEAHKMSATYFGSEVKYTKRYQLGRLLSTLTRHFLLLTATPHNGKEEDFQLFMALLDGDRFEGKYRDNAHVTDVTGLMRRMTKEQLLKFDKTPLFPERIAYTVEYPLSDLETDLYAAVTNYVREEFNRADALENDKRKGTVGFALTILQRRLASSPEAIWQSLRRRRERLERRLEEERLIRRGEEVRERAEGNPPVEDLEPEDLDDIDDAPDGEDEELEEQIVDQATAAQTIRELQLEIAQLQQLEDLAARVRRSNVDTKWKEMSALLQDNAEMFDAHGHRRKLVIFTEHKDTLNYLAEKIRGVIGRPEALVAIHGGLAREERKKAQEAFTQDKGVEILVATDAAGEGINLQRAHLMVNYDLPWNPNRLEQRFGRIHRIGQTEVCHLWNMVAQETREGEVFRRLLEKIDEERKALKGAVFDILGQVFQGRELRKLLIEAVRYGDRLDVRAKLTQAVDVAMDHDRLREIVEGGVLARDVLDPTHIERIRADMERAEARKLQPHFISSFFLEAFRHLGGTIHEREAKRFEITHVPSPIRVRDRQIGIGVPVLMRYERVTFEKKLVFVPGKAMAALVCPGHPLLDCTIDLVIERYADQLKRGAILIDRNDLSETPRLLFLLEHEIRDGRLTLSGDRRVISRRMQFLQLAADGSITFAGYAPHLVLEPAAPEEIAAVQSVAEQAWLRDDLDAKATSFAISKLVPDHLADVRSRKDDLIKKTRQAVKDRLTKEFSHWDHRAQHLKAEEQAGKQPRMNWQKAQQRADELRDRLKRRLDELDRESQISPSPPLIAGGALVIPEGLLAKLQGRPTPGLFAKETARVERLAIEAVLEAERSLGHEPQDVGAEKRGYDIESKDGRKDRDGRLRFLEVKGRVSGASTVTITKNEIMTGLNKPDAFILALVEVDGERAKAVRYVRTPFGREPDFGVTSVDYDLGELLERSEDPS